MLMLAYECCCCCCCCWWLGASSLDSGLEAYLSTGGGSDGDPDGVDRAGDVPLFASSIQLFIKVRSALPLC